MTYEEFSDLLWEKQSLKNEWNGHAIRVMMENGHVYVKGPIGQPIETFSSLSEAFERWCLNEARQSLSEIVKGSAPENWEKDPEFADLAFLDPELFAGPTQIRRNSLTLGKGTEDDSFVRSCIRASEKMNACLYGVSPDMRIYHTLPWRRLKELLVNKRLFLTNPLSYNDRWESFLINDGESGATQVKGMVWGVSCWSLREESEGLWNNNVRGSRCPERKSGQTSPEKSGIGEQKVKIESTVGALLAAIVGKLDQDNLWESCRMGRVKYYDEFYLRRYKKQVCANFSNFGQDVFGQACLQSFFMKRLPYDYEQEVRLVARKTQDMESKCCGFFLNCVPQQFIHEVTVNPDCSRENYEAIKGELAALTIDHVRMSSLAKPCPKDI